MKIIAVGSNGSKAGKSVACNLLMEMLGKRKWHYLSTSDVLIDMLSDKLGLSADYIRANKEVYRERLVKLGEEDPLRAMYKCFSLWDEKKNMLVESVRRREEYELLKGYSATFIYVYAKEETRKKRGAGDIDVNEAPECLIVQGEPVKNVFMVNNDGTYSSLKIRLGQILQHIS